MNWEELFEKGNEHIGDKEYDKAIICFEEALKICPKDNKWKIYGNLGHCYQLKENYDEAIECYKQALDVCPDNEEGKWTIHWSLGHCYQSKENYDEAINYYKRALETCPDKKKWIIYYSLGN